jgi:hypothetical protein
LRKLLILSAGMALTLAWGLPQGFAEQEAWQGIHPTYVPNWGANAPHVAPGVQAPFVDKKLNDDTGAEPQLEPFIAAFGDTLYSGWKDWRTTRKRIWATASTNGGTTWSPNLIIPESTSAYLNSSDVWIDTDRFGNGYYATLPYNDPQSASDVSFTKTTDAGLSFAPQVTASRNSPGFDDKDALCVRGDTVYVAWDAGNVGRFARSTNRGASFGAFINYGGANSVIGAIPQVSASGSVVYIMYENTGTGNNMFTKSTNGGTSFGLTSVAQTVSSNYNVPWSFSFAILPDFVVDRNNGNLYVAWTDSRNNTGYSDILLSRSTDGGTSWSSAVAVNEPGTVGDATLQFMPMLAVDPGNGVVYCCWYDTRNNSNQLDVYATFSADGGQTWTHPDTRMSLVSSTPLPDTLNRFSDYIGAAASKGRGFFVWVDARNGNPDTYFNILQGPSGVAESPPTARTYRFDLAQSIPNPTGSRALIRYELSKSGPAELSVYNVQGQRIATLTSGSLSAGRHEVTWQGRDDAGRAVPNGVYLYRLNAGGESLSRRLVLVR